MYHVYFLTHMIWNEMDDILLMAQLINQAIVS